MLATTGFSLGEDKRYRTYIWENESERACSERPELFAWSSASPLMGLVGIPPPGLKALNLHPGAFTRVSDPGLKVRGWHNWSKYT